jgi:hypothetical protein
MMYIYKITKLSGEINQAISKSDIWTGDPTIASVELVGPEVISTPPPEEPSVKSAYDIYHAFTPTERKAIRAAAKVNADVEDFQDSLDKAIIAGRDLATSSDSEVDLALDALEAAGLIAEGRKEEIIA